MSIILDIYGIGNKIMLPENIDLLVSHYYVIQISRRTYQKPMRSKGMKPMLTAETLFHEEERFDRNIEEFHFSVKGLRF